MIPASLIDRAQAVRIEDEITRRGLKLVGRVEREGPCPVCGGRDRFSINTKKQCLNCRGCGAKGDVIALVRFLDGCDFRAAVETLAGEGAGPRPGKMRPPAKVAVTDHSGFDAPEFDAPKPSKPAADCNDDDSAKAAVARWNRATGPRGTIVETYLTERGLVLADDIAGEVIRLTRAILGRMTMTSRTRTTSPPRLHSPCGSRAASAFITPTSTWPPSRSSASCAISSAPASLS